MSTPSALPTVLAPPTGTGNARSPWRFIRPNTAQPPADNNQATFQRQPSRCVSFWQRYVFPGMYRKRAIKILLNHPIYRGLLLVLTFILLFGAQLRELIMPPSADAACDVILTVTFILFCLDMFMRLDSDPTYFSCSCGLVTKHRNTMDETAHSNLPSQSSGNGCFGLKVGSFLFWCDLISSLTLLSQISFVHKAAFDPITVRISLDQFGVPVSISL